MLFDLRGRGRRRTVRVIYGGLALLIGAGLVFFGVGAGVGGGGLLNSLTGNEGSSGASFSAQIEKYKKLTQKQPTSVYAWEQLTLAQLHEAGGETYVTRAGVTSKGKELYNQITQSWNRYLALNPPKPNLTLAKEMVSVYDEEGLNEPTEAVKVLQTIVATEPTNAAYYSLLAEYAYKAHNTRIGDLASAKAIALAPASRRKLLKSQLAEIKAHPNGPEGTTTTPSGQPVKVKSAGNGTFTGSTTTKTSAPSGSPTGTSTGATTTK
jgi:hypothetical protein